MIMQKSGDKTTLHKLKTQRDSMLAWYIGIAVFLLECAAGYYYNFYVGYYHGDGISRVANAFYVLYSRDPHLGAIGFVWNPLPSFVNMLFLLFYPLIPAMATKGLAGLLMSAIFASLTAVIMVLAMLQRRLPRWSAAVFTLLFSLNPMIFIFGFNGMSDSPFMFFIIWCILRFLDWLDYKKTGDLVAASFALALSFWCRYEAVPFGFSMIVSSIIVVFLMHEYKQPANESSLRYKWSRMEGVIAIIATPLFYSGVLWLLLNAIIMNNPLNFLNGEYTNIAQIEGHLESTLYSAMLGNPLQSILFAAKKVLIFSAPLFSILALKIFNRRLFQGDTLVLLGMYVSIPLLQVLMLMKGTTLGWLRYFIYVLPVTLAWLPYELSKITRKWQIILPLFALIMNFGMLSYAITQPSIAPDENTFLQNSFGKKSATYYDWKRYIEISNYLDEFYPQSTILTDSFSSFFIILQSEFPKRFYITSDSGFKDAITNPSGYQVDYFLIPRTGSSSVISAVNNAYPDLFDKGADWAELVRDFDGKWRLYKIVNKKERATQ